MTVTIDLEKNEIGVYYSAEFVGKNTCQEGYLDKITICDKNIPFTIGMLVNGTNPKPSYSNFKLYGCRFYDKILNSDEIKLNYEASKNLLNN